MGRPKTLTADPEAIDPSEWGALGSYTYQNVLYGRGEPVPAMPLSMAEGLARRGMIARRNTTGAVVSMPPPEPKSADEYLRGPDLVILRTIRRTRPSVTIMTEIAALAQSQNRSETLREALALAIELVPSE